MNATIRVEVTWLATYIAQLATLVIPKGLGAVVHEDASSHTEVGLFYSPYKSRVTYRPGTQVDAIGKQKQAEVL